MQQSSGTKLSLRELARRGFLSTGGLSPLIKTEDGLQDSAVATNTGLHVISDEGRESLIESHRRSS